MKKRLLALLCLLWLITGCASINTPRHKNTIEENMLLLQETVNQQDIEIKNLNDLIKEKNAEIKELKNKLSAFGVFE